MQSAFELLLLSTPVFFMGQEYESAISFSELYKGLCKSSRNVKWKDSVATYHANALKNTYTLNAKTHIHPLKQGVMFLKWRFILTGSGKVVRRMSKQSIAKERRKLKKLQRRVLDGKCTLDDMRTNFQSWKANAERGNTHGIVIQMEAYLNKLIREVLKK